jgi:catechol 2,3-dioxygenase-like lactoylglutathione lyase family enzyme
MPMTERSALKGLRGFAQLSVVVNSIEETVSFYRDLFGFEVDGDWEGDSEGLEKMLGIANITGRSVVGNIGHLRIEFMDYSIFGKGPLAFPGSLGVNNLTFEVEDIDATHSQCVEMGLSPGHEPAAISNVRQFFILDPNGITLEFVEYNENREGLRSGDLDGQGARWTRG